MSNMAELKWLDDLVIAIHKIAIEMKKDIFKRYRQVGQAILETGYEECKHGSKEEMRASICDRLNIKDRTFANMIKLAEMNEEQFCNDIAKFKSLYSWANPKPLPKPESKIGDNDVEMKEIEIDITRFNDQAEAEQFFLRFGGCFMDTVTHTYYKGTVDKYLYKGDE